MRKHNPPLLTRAECALYVGVSRQRVGQKIKDGNLPVVQHGSVIFIERRHAEKWKRQRSEKP